MSGYLELPDGGLIGVRDGIVIGRVAACDIVVEDGKASRRHARLVVEAGVVEVEDMQSSNGTMLNGKNVTRRMLRDGDVIGIGKSEIVYREGPLPVRGSRSASAGSGASGGADDSFATKTPAAAPTQVSPATPAPRSRPVFDDDDDLLGGGDAPRTPTSATPAPRPEPPAPTPPEPKPAAPKPAAPKSPAPVAPSADDSDDDDDLLAPPPTPAPVAAGDDLLPPPKPAPAAGNVVEFEDEVVEVQTPAHKPPAPRPSGAGRAEPSIEVRKPQPTKAGAAKGAAAKGQQSSDDVVASSQRILQYSKKGGGGGVLGDDLNQMSGGTRALIVLVALAAGGGIIWAIAAAMQ